MKGRFLEETTIHGLKYLTISRNSFERIIWLLAILCSLSLCTVIVCLNVRNWQLSPTVVSIEGKSGYPTNFKAHSY